MRTRDVRGCGHSDEIVGREQQDLYLRDPRGDAEVYGLTPRGVSIPVPHAQQFRTVHLDLNAAAEDLGDDEGVTREVHFLRQEYRSFRLDQERNRQDTSVTPPFPGETPFQG